MGQEEVKKALKKSNSWLLSNEIAKSTGQSLKSIQSSLRRLVKWGEVKKEPASKVIQDDTRLKEKSFTGYAYKIKDYKTLDDYKFKDKTVLLRLDLNSQIYPSFIPSEHFSHHIPTILELIEKQAKLVILTNQETNDRSPKNSIPSLNPHATFLSTKINQKVSYIEDIVGKQAQESIKKMKAGEVIMLKNLLAEKEENTKLKKQEKTKLVKTLSELADYYINDAFSLAHLSTTSLTGFPQKMQSCIGRYFEKEIELVNNLFNPAKPCLYILGGDKPNELINMTLKSLENKRADMVLTSGFISHILYLARGSKLGGQEKKLKDGNVKLTSEVKKLSAYNEVALPVDFRTSTLGITEQILLHHLPIYQDLHDIGPRTLENYKSLISKAKTIVVKGTLGMVEDENFQESTKAMLQELEKTKAFTYILGNSTVDCFKNFKISMKNIKHLSKNSKPIITYLTEEKLPAVEVLKIKQ